jgi:uncharacterized membrane protein HdeD (DUF308 family)
MITLTVLLTIAIVLIVVGILVTVTSYPHEPDGGCLITVIGFIFLLLTAAYFIGTLHALPGH